MARDVDPKRTRKAKRLVARLQSAKDQAAAPYSGWEEEFLDEVGARLDKYGSAFRDLAKGRAEDAVSVLQAQKLKEIAAKAKGKDRAARAEARAARKAARATPEEEAKPAPERRYSSFRRKSAKKPSRRTSIDEP